MKMKNLILGLLVFVSGCVSATVEVSRACDSKTVTFPGAPLNPGVTIPPVTQSFTLDLGEGKDLLTEALLVDGTLSRTDGSDLSFLDEILISVVSPNGDDDLVLWDSKANTGTTLSVKASDANLVNYIDSNNKFTVNVVISTQQPPTSDWGLDAALCISAKAEKSYGL
jgi:hypothetical protein